MSIIPHSPALFLAFYAQILLQASAEGLYQKYLDLLLLFALHNSFISLLLWDSSVNP